MGQKIGRLFVPGTKRVQKRPDFQAFIGKCRKIKRLGMVEAAGVEPDTSVENAQVIDFGNARSGMFSKIAKSTVRSLYSLFPEFQQLLIPSFRRPSWRQTSILKYGCSISQVFRGRDVKSAPSPFCSNLIRQCKDRSSADIELTNYRLIAGEPILSFIQYETRQVS